MTAELFASGSGDCVPATVDKFGIPFANSTAKQTSPTKFVAVDRSWNVIQQGRQRNDGIRTALP